MGLPLACHLDLDGLYDAVDIIIEANAQRKSFSSGVRMLGEKATGNLVVFLNHTLQPAKPLRMPSD